MTPDHESRVRQRAHEIWEREGRPEGRDREHWAQAEAELADPGKKASRKAAAPKAKKAEAAPGVKPTAEKKTAPGKAAEPDAARPKAKKAEAAPAAKPTAEKKPAPGKAAEPEAARPKAKRVAKV